MCQSEAGGLLSLKDNSSATQADKAHGMVGKKNHYLGGYTSLVNFRCSQEQKALWKAQADAKGLKLSAWIQKQLQRGLDGDY